MTILVLGATGKTGSRVATALGSAARPASRSSAQRFDWSDESTWDAALAGASAVYLVPPATNLDPTEVAAFVPRAVAAGVTRIVLLSARGIDPEDGREAAVRASTVDWTILRPTWFQQNFSEDFLAPMVRAGEVVLPLGPGGHPFIDAQDIADVAVAALTRDGHAGRVYELSGPEALSFPAAVGLVAEATGRHIELVDVPGAVIAEALRANGFSEEYATVLGYGLEAIRDGHDAAPSTGVQEVLGREPRPFADYVKAAASSGAWA
ncbi:NAD(P)H-binding protein [Actinosynnema sp. NPDC047251]|uniref:NmrA family protein n=1 Tax=Saccharothrix espanaensis (strain ATCC 51144 / DSM 44229 / JCM 9112 / NBRC 15066 / NRRL 15764) TaxID=1179773 RepID=K0JWJ1_SACES|nr:NAD(P)H-binding protein [Saccharothrix espanaensis]CCH29144.1 NmrA family protein [Saccharothrix espanaensis DSM 44229]